MIELIEKDIKTAIALYLTYSKKVKARQNILSRDRKNIRLTLLEVKIAVFEI